jgi:oligopeptide transport system ATP-binding protein
MSITGTPLLQTRGLQKRYKLRGGSVTRQITAVDDVSIEVASGETLAVVGESGCGKSTLAKLVTQLEIPDDGELIFDGRPILRGSRRERLAFCRDVQIIFQDPYGSLTPHFRVGTLIAEPLRIHRLATRSTLPTRIAEILDNVGLAPEIAQRFPHELSGGQRQRVSIARAIATQPRLIVCDEPVSALDVSVRSQIVNLLLDLQRDLGLSYLFISHDLALVDHIADVICVMYMGRIVEQAPAGAFFAAPRHPYSRALIASSPVPDPRRRNSAPAVHGEVEVGATTSGCRFRSRCPLAVAKCVETDPPLRLLAAKHLVACHRAEELVGPIPLAERSALQGSRTA